INEVAIGSNGTGRIDVIMSDVRTLNDANKTVESILFNRPTTLAGFLQPTPLETITEGSSYSAIGTTRAPDGSLVAYWQQSNGASSDLYASRSGPVPGNLATWTDPIRLTSDPNLELKPSLAVDTDGSYQVIYEMQTPVNQIPGRPGIAAPVDPPVGAP